MICKHLTAKQPPLDRKQISDLLPVYELLYTSIGQAIAAYAPNVYFAAISNPLLLVLFLPATRVV